MIVRYYYLAFALVINGVVAMVAGREDTVGNRKWTWGSFFLGGLYLLLGLGLLGADTFASVAVLVKTVGWLLVFIGASNIVFSFIAKRES